MSKRSNGLDFVDGLLSLAAPPPRQRELSGSAQSPISSAIGASEVRAGDASPLLQPKARPSRDPVDIDVSCPRKRRNTCLFSLFFRLDDLINGNQIGPLKQH